MRSAILLWLVASFLILSTPAAAEDLRQRQQQLEQIRQRIDQAQANLQAQRQSENDISRDLALLSGQLQRLDQRIAELRKEQQALKREIDGQQQQLRRSETEAREVGRRLEQRLVALYKEGDSGLLKILFSAETPSQLIQQYYYLTRVMENDTVLLDEYRELITSQQEKLARLTQLQQRQSNLLQQEEAERQTAASTRTLQDRLLSQARSESKKLKAELAELQENAKQLGALVDKLKRAPPPPAPAARPGEVVDFSRQRGSLAWPLEGAVLISFGTQRDNKLGTFFESNGIEIAARPGSEVRSVANGQVVYADFFRGYGNLLIISHDGGYHTLYAQLDRIDKKTGDRVATGVVVGRSGLAGRESIYFEIRHNGAPVNPLTWLKH